MKKKKFHETRLKNIQNNLKTELRQCYLENGVNKTDKKFVK